MPVVKRKELVPRYFTKGEFNPRSKDQLLAYMATLGDKGGAATASGKASTDKKVMQALARKNPFYKDLLDFSKIGKIKSTYADGAEAILDANNRLHAEFWHLPSTMRLSCKVYNLQNIVADKDGEGSPAAGFRHCVVAPSGSKLVEADASAVEAVFSGYFMGDPNYIRLAQLGVHDYLTSHMVGKPADLRWPDKQLGDYFKWIKATYEKERHLAKKTVHAVNFGQTPFGMVKGSPETFTLKLATELQELYFKICPKLKEWQDTLRSLAYKNQYLGLNNHPWKYRHAFYSVFTTNAEQTKRRNGKDANRVVAFYPQSTNAGFQAEVAIRVAKRIKERWPQELSSIRALIHDSILSEVKDEYVDEVVRIKAEEMSRPIKEMPCPPEWGMGPYLKIGVEVKVGQSWATMQKVKLQEELGTASDTAVKEWEEEEEDVA
jgi:DNA polymerase I-like protein with 3'-5' exonuclease and polymerase domains